MSLFKKAITFFIISCTLLILGVPVYAAQPKKWYAVRGTYVKDDGALSLMYLDNDVVMFEFSMTQASKDEDILNKFRLAGSFYLDDNGIGIYEHPKTGNVKITFDLSEGKVSVKQTGKLPIDVSGRYKFSKDFIKVTEDAAIEILEQLPTAATSLNHNNG